MPLSKSQLDRMIDRVDEALSVMGRAPKDADRNTDPQEFGESPAARELPVSEPADPLMDAARRPKRSLF